MGLDCLRAGIGSMIWADPAGMFFEGVYASSGVDGEEAITFLQADQGASICEGKWNRGLCGGLLVPVEDAQSPKCIPSARPVVAVFEFKVNLAEVRVL